MHPGAARPPIVRGGFSSMTVDACTHRFGGVTVMPHVPLESQGTLLLGAPRVNEGTCFLSSSEVDALHGAERDEQ